VKIDVEGNIIAKPDTDYAINKSGYVIHGAIHKARPTSPASSTPIRAPAWRSRR
jgi:ribulose-5-phosphate 4-epimerase/fuculose-1-phosphate aldolase